MCLNKIMESHNQPTEEAKSNIEPITTVKESIPETKKVLSRAEILKRSFLQILIGCLIGAASIAVIAVLFGSFSDILERALATIAIVSLHALLSFSYVSATEKKDLEDGGRSIELFSNVVFTVLVLSFITSTFAIWGLFGGMLVLKLYLSYGVVLFATLHAEVLYRIRKYSDAIDSLITTNYFFMAVVVGMLFLAIASIDATDLGEFFYRLLTATGIIDATMTITAVIMHKLYMQKHPELETTKDGKLSSSKNFWKNPFVVILLIFLGLQVLGGIVNLIVRSSL